MTKEEKQFNQWFDWYADGVKVFEEADMKQAYLQGRATLEKENAELERKLEHTEKDLAGYQFNYPTIKELQKENADLRKIAEFQQSNNMNTHLENKKLKEGLAVGSTWNKHLNSLNKELEEERDKYRNMVFDKDEQLTKARVLLKQFLEARNGEDIYKAEFEAEQFLKE